MDRRLTRTDILVLTLCAIILILSGALLYFEITQSYGSGTGRPVGEVSYRNRIVQRRDPSQVIWQRLDPGDTVFNGDSVRTDDTAEAIIELEDGARIELDPESLIVLHLRDRLTVSLLRGSAILTPGSGGMGFERSGKSFIAEAGPVRLFADPDHPDNGTIDTDGNASVLAPDGTVILRPGESLEILNGAERRYRKEIQTLSPGDNARLFLTGDGVEVEFQWEPRPGKSVLEISKGYPYSENTEFLSVPAGSKHVLKLEAGNYFWRVRQGEDSSRLRRLRIRKKDSPQLLLPGPDAKLRISGESGYVAFRWKEEEFASSYFVELARDRGFTERVAYQAVQRNGISLPLNPGRYYWRVLARGTVPGSESESTAASFEVVQSEKSIAPGKENTRKEPEALEKKAAGEEKPALREEPVRADSLALTYPVGVVDMTGKSFLAFRWKGIPTRERMLQLRNATGTVVFQTRVTGNAFTLTDLTVLDTGVFRWSLESEGENAQARFTIVLREELEAPKLDIR